MPTLGVKSDQFEEGFANGVRHIREDDVAKLSGATGKAFVSMKVPSQDRVNFLKNFDTPVDALLLDTPICSPVQVSLGE